MRGAISRQSRAEGELKQSCSHPWQRKGRKGREGGRINHGHAKDSAQKPGLELQKMQPEPNLSELKSKKVDKDQLRNSSQGQTSSCEGFLGGVAPFSREKPGCTRSLHVVKQNQKASKQDTKVTQNQNTRT